MVGAGAAAGALAAWLTVATIIGDGSAGLSVPREEMPMVAVKRWATIDLANYRWENRLVLIFAPTTANPALTSQLDTFAGRDTEVVDRDLLLGSCPLGENGNFGGAPSDVSAGEMLREELGVATDGFTVLLIGKDGGVKLRSATPLPAEKIFATIDSMPMRQREMR